MTATDRDLDAEDRRTAAALAAGGLDRRTPLITPYDVAAHLIVRYVARGDDVTWLAHGGLGGGDRDSYAHIGGYAWWSDGRRKKVDCWHIIVERVAGQDLAEPAIFPLRAVYDALYRRMFGARQLPLFAEVS